MLLSLPFRVCSFNAICLKYWGTVVLLIWYKNNNLKNLVRTISVSLVFKNVIVAVFRTTPSNVPYHYVI